LQFIQKYVIISKVMYFCRRQELPARKDFMVMRIFLIDFENVHSEGLTGVDSLSENDEVVIFYSNNADSISFEMMHKLMFSKAKLSYYKVRRGGRNALDFQMASYLGYLVNACAVAERPMNEVEFFLISRDNGFDFVIDFWESGNINVKPKVKRFFAIKAAFAQPKAKAIEPPKAIAVPSPAPVAAAEETVPVVIEEKPVSKKKPPAKKKPALKEQVVVVEAAEVAAEPASVDAAVIIDLEIAAAIEKLLTEAETSHGLYISSVKRFGQKKGVEIYRNIKSRFSVKKTI